MTLKKSIKTYKNQLVIGTLFLVGFAFVIASFTTDNVANNNYTPKFLDVKGAWADSVLKSLTPNERIAQLFMVAAYSNKGVEHKK